ncbi:LAME_0G00342g1_1 [Lachancea meyersii CBS 8951]|uniref:LAME_0G00342g1_1 n=1 Tax=Lachancea meyersii CBS 8951 TaxID=1266667 RepID=A0A1G4K4N3_9SACH|nr:LAME_0G00342g1_1 [Lachancea meyersii CBS 8951]
MKTEEVDPNVLSHIFKTSKIFDTVDAFGPTKTDHNAESIAISGLESFTGLFDDIHLLKSFGIIGEQNVIYKKINKGGLCSKVWLVSLVLSSRKNLSEIFQLAVSRSKLRKEEIHFAKCAPNSVRKVLGEKISLKIQEIDRRLRLAVLELLQNFAYLILAAVDVFKIRIGEKWKRLLERISGLFTILKFLFSSVFPS